MPCQGGVLHRLAGNAEVVFIQARQHGADTSMSSAEDVHQPDLLRHIL